MPDEFGNTRWSLVVVAGHGDSSEARRALSMLCEEYWFPLFAFGRRAGWSADEAADLVQSFIVELLEKCTLARADRARGRFRSFLLKAFQHFAANQRRRTQAAKRGGKLSVFSLDRVDAESRYGRMAVDTASPDRVYERQWALTILDRVRTTLAADYAAAGKARRFDALYAQLGVAADALPQRDLAAQLQMSESAVKSALYRLRRQFRDVLRAEVAQTLTRDQDLEVEIRELQAALSAD